MSVIYLLSSLPMLKFDARPALSTEAFAAACREQLRPADAAAAEALARGEPSDHPFAQAWLDKDAILRNAVARHRARLAGQEPERWTRPARGCDSQLESEVEDAFQAPDPLARERELDKARWRAAEELQGPDPLCLGALFAYAIKLALLNRWSALSAGEGRAALDRLVRQPLALNLEP